MKEKFGVAPDQVVDVLALMGDSIDNIKGVPGIGEKGARDLIATYGTLEELLAHAPEVSNKRYREGLLAHADDARQSRELARIRTNVPVEFVAESVRYRGASRERCFELFTRLGFRTLVMEYAPTAGTIGKDYAIVRTIEEVRDARDGVEGGRALRLPRAARCPVGDAVGHCGARVLDPAAGTRATCRLPTHVADGDLFGAGPVASRRHDAWRARRGGRAGGTEAASSRTSPSPRSGTT